jgi:hypothetical protein
VAELYRKEIQKIENLGTTLGPKMGQVLQKISDLARVV